MICPQCKKEIKWVRVYSECWQKGYLEGDTNRIADYGEVGETTETIAIECPECTYDLMPKGEVEG
jgi:DNA-directed RNA polymerase subunit RPC12/RpoP